MRFRVSAGVRVGSGRPKGATKMPRNFPHFVERRLEGNHSRSCWRYSARIAVRVSARDQARVRLWAILSPLNTNAICRLCGGSSSLEGNQSIVGVGIEG